jgi:hypothetical protein
MIRIASNIFTTLLGKYDQNNGIQKYEIGETCNTHE